MIINENVDTAELAMAAAAAGPEPEGSKLTREERLHLIVKIADLREALQSGDLDQETRAREAISAALTERGLRSHHIADTFRDHLTKGSPVTLANAFAVHPRMREAA
ncbi:hypothetical protein [Streptomyces sp. 5-10]|uniref:hypothetical protein n=1 Tax=Streptomyces sp. 5-10 TaxID=878925 RepID=UPI00168B7605|nr:hypothetical protein [Streptomyces sp. 5-10]MBD3004612.1 hypothetical protein [Streptomyces sp. 5-10]